MSIASRLTILCAILRHIHLLLHIYFSGELASLAPSAFIVDQLSAGLPLLRGLLAPSVPVLFYCHFPDLLLAQGRESALKRLYRVPFDRIEEFSMGFADAVAVNSNFTKSVVARTWPRLASQVDTKVVYPCVDIDPPPAASNADKASTLFNADEKVILSINRFERKKDIALAIRAFAAIPPAQRQNVRLVLAGGYDHRVSENVHYHTELQQLATSLNLEHETIINNNNADDDDDHSSPPTKDQPTAAPVLFLLSVPNALKTSLLNSATLLVYTPSNEHFGIVPLEAMLARLPVLAANTGGPVETVQDAKTGWLRRPDDAEAWSEVMRSALEMTDAARRKMGDDGAKRVKELFGREHMAATIDEVLDEIKDDDARDAAVGVVSWGVLAVAAGMSVLVPVGMVAVAMWFANKTD
jgi:alpha-1,3/alpha-1,6-mannosyltransferase